LEQASTAKDEQLAELSRNIQSLEQASTAKDEQLADLTIQLNDREQKLSSIEQSIIWQFTMKFHSKIIERLLPHNTRRRRSYDLGRAGGKILVNEGWDSFWYKFNERNHHKRSLEGTVFVNSEIKYLVQPEEMPDPLDINISIIIPTKNAGQDFEFVLEKIKNQKCIRNIEIVIVDSGSTDTTIEIAKKYQCKIFSIRSEDFNHGLARDYGAEKASGEFVVFLVQDAIPIGEYWLYNMAEILLKDQKIAAVTCRQVPRSDADLFAGFILWSHYKSLNRTHNEIYSCFNRFNELMPQEKRIVAGIEDTCCMMQKQIFDQFKFREIPYGEDIDLGIRFMESGYKTAFEFSTGVIHSHNRDSAYFFKRSFIDTQVLDSLLNTIPKSSGPDTSLKNIVEQVQGLFLLIKMSEMRKEKNSGLDTQGVIDLLKKSLHSRIPIPESRRYFTDTDDLGSIDSKKSLDSILSECARLVNAQSVIADDTMVNSYCTILDDFAKYCSAYGSLEGREKELCESFDKIFALIAGSTLATYYCKRSKDQLSDSDLAMKKILEVGI
jgi:GT2 family glycosyltransferase